MVTSPMRILALALLVLGLPAVAVPMDAPTAAPPVESAEVKRARDLFDAAEKLYRQRKYAAAVVKFEEAYAARPHPVVAFNLARCREQLGDAPAALRWYREYLRLAQRETDQEKVLQAVAELERKLRALGVQQVSILSDPPGAKVSINGREVGSTPVTTELSEGEHEVTVSLTGYVTAQQRYAHTLLRASDLNVQLARVPELPVVEPSPQTLVAPLPAPAPAVATAPPPSEGTSFRFKWVAGGAAVAAGGAGVALGLSAGAARRALVDAPSPLEPPRAQELYDRAQSHAVAANAAYATAAVAAVTAAVLFLLDR